MLRQAMHYMKKHGIKKTVQTGTSLMKYAYEHRNDEKEERAKAVQPLHGEICFSIVMPVYNVEIKWLAKAIESVTNQNYTNWELCIADDCSTDPGVREYLKTITDERIRITYMEKNGGISAASNAAAESATGEYILLMDNDDEIAPTALYEFYQKIIRTHADIVYSDQNIVDGMGRTRDPLCKPDWSYDLFLSQMYVGHLLGFKKSLFTEVGGFRSEFNGSQDYDLMLRMIEHTDRIAHIPKILYSWRDIPSSTAGNPEAKPYAQTAGLRALQEHVDRKLGVGRATVLETESLFVYDVRYHLDEEPLVSVIIPTKDHVDLLEKAIDSIESKTTYRNYEIIILDNNSEKEETAEYLKKVVKQYPNVRVEEAFFEFNWSKLNNYGMTKAKGDVYIFLNNDIEIIAGEWMTRLAENVVRPEIGVAGGLLLYEDGTIQHAGVVPGMKGWAEHVFKGMKPVHYGSPFVSPMVTRNVSAVTGACMAVSKKTIEQIGTFDERFIICASDIELCIRAYQAGKRNVYLPSVKMYHYESKSRDSFIPEIDFKMSDRIYVLYRKNGDPYYNKQLDMNSCQPKVGKTMLNKEKISFLAKKAAEYARSTGNISTKIAEINPYEFRKSEFGQPRINLVVPSINTEHVFGGIATALKFYNKVVETTGYACRLILVDADPSAEAVEKYSKEYGYTFVKPEEDKQDPKQIVPYAFRAGKSLPVSKKDYFIFTGWWTAHCVQEAYDDWKLKDGYEPNVFLYLIQDYEPGFYPWSSKYLLADATYKTGYPTIAIFNSLLLQEFFHNNGYHFLKEYAFEPVLNEGLKKTLDCLPVNIPKKKQILIYGRPGTPRNAFELVIGSLEKWTEIQDNASDWTILSAGEQHKNITLPNGMEVMSAGKMSIDEYADVLAESYAGISLMASPHPSYPPLEMSVFGVKVITNTYANKNLASFNDNIVSVDCASPGNIARELKKICDGYQECVPFVHTNESYINNQAVFDFVAQIKEDLEQ